MESLPVNERSSEDPLSYAVVTAVAKFKDTEPKLLEPPLHEAIDPDALNSIFSDGDETGRKGKVSFVYSGCHVAVDDDGRVLVREDEENSTGSA